MCSSDLQQAQSAGLKVSQKCFSHGNLPASLQHKDHLSARHSSDSIVFVGTARECRFLWIVFAMFVCWYVYTRVYVCVLLKLLAEPPPHV